MVDHRDLIMQQVRIGFVEVNPLFEDGLVVVMQRQTRSVVDAWAFEGRSTVLISFGFLRKSLIYI